MYDCSYFPICAFVPFAGPTISGMIVCWRTTRVPNFNNTQTITNAQYARWRRTAFAPLRSCPSTSVAFARRAHIAHITRQQHTQKEVQWRTRARASRININNSIPLRCMQAFRPAAAHAHAQVANWKCPHTRLLLYIIHTCTQAYRTYTLIYHGNNDVVSRACACAFRSNTLFVYLYLHSKTFHLFFSSSPYRGYNIHFKISSQLARASSCVFSCCRSSACVFYSKRRPSIAWCIRAASAFTYVHCPDRKVADYVFVCCLCVLCARVPVFRRAGAVSRRATFRLVINKYHKRASDLYHCCRWARRDLRWECATQLARQRFA